MGCDIHASLEYLNDCNWSSMNLHTMNRELVDYDFTDRSYAMKNIQYNKICKKIY